MQQNTTNQEKDIPNKKASPPIWKQQWFQKDFMAGVLQLEGAATKQKLYVMCSHQSHLLGGMILSRASGD